MIYDIKKEELKIHDLVKKRWSPRSFKDKALGKEQVINLINAARLAASSYNEQPWRFIIGMKDDDSYRKIRESLVESNQVWTSAAPVLLLAVAKKTFSKNGKVNRHAFYDTGQAMATLALQATADGLHVHQMGGFSPKKASELFDIPEDFEPVTACAIGYSNAPDQKERIRKPLEEIAFTDEWGNSFKP